MVHVSQPRVVGARPKYHEVRGKSKGPATRCVGAGGRRKGRARSGRGGEGWRVEQEDGHAGTAEDAIDDAAPEELGAPDSAARAERDQIRPEGFGLDQDFLDGLAEADDTLHRNALEPRR